MALIKKKTRKRLSKQVRKLVKKHGPEKATGLVSTLVAAVSAKLATTTDDRPKKGKKHKGVKPSSMSA